MHNQINLRKLDRKTEKKQQLRITLAIYAFFIGFFFRFLNTKGKRGHWVEECFYLPLHIKTEFHSIFLRSLIHSKSLIGDIIQFSFLRVLQCCQAIFCIHLVNSENVNINLPSVAYHLHKQRQ